MPFTRDQLEDINRIISNTTTTLCSDKNFLCAIVAAVSDTVIEKCNQKFMVQGDKIDSLEQEINVLKSENNMLKKACINLEQYTRRNSVRVFGLKEDYNENCEELVKELFKTKLNVDINNSYFNRVHRVGVPNAAKKRAIVVSFTSYKYRQLVFSKKKLLRNTGIIIREDLSKERLELLIEAQKRVGRDKAWTRDGSVR